MESLSELLSPFDDFDILCEEHGLTCIGLCANYMCKDKTKFLCMKCVRSGQTCITKEKHELVTLSELLYRFFIKEQSKSIDFMEIQNMQQIIKEYDKGEINKIISQSKTIKEDYSAEMNQIQTIFSNLINYISESYKDNNNVYLNKLKDLSIPNLENDKDIKLLLNIKMPEVDKKNMDNNQKLIDFMNKGYKLTSPQNFINSVKFLNDTNKFTEVSNKLNKKIYYNEISFNNEEKKKKLSNKIDSLLKELELKFDEKMTQIEDEIILSKNNPIIYSSHILALKFTKDPKDYIYKEDLCSTAHKTNSIDKVFCAFKSFSGESLVVWGTPQYNIEFFDLEKNKIIRTIIKAHTQTIFSCRHYADVKHRINYVITSSYDRTVKVWDLKTYSYLVNILNAHSGYYIYSVSILFEEEENSKYIITSAPNEYMKIWDFNGKYIRNFGQNDESTYFIDVYYNSKEKKNYILNANSNDVKSYSFQNGEIYHKYKGTPQTWHMSAVVNETREQNILIESDGNGYIRMWEFNTANLIKTISSSSSLNLRGICLWNDDYLFAAGNDYQVKLIDLSGGKLVKSFKGHSSTVCSLEKIVHPKYGECLISQALDGKLKVWASQK